MIPDLGKYQSEVLASYGVTLLLLLGLFGLSWYKGRRIAKALRDVEERKVENG